MGPKMLSQHACTFGYTDSAFYDLCLTSSVVSVSCDVQVTVVDLKPDGRNIPVTEKNKKEYIK